MWEIERDGISKIKFEAGLPHDHFLVTLRFRSRRRPCCLSSLVTKLDDGNWQPFIFSTLDETLRLI